MRRVAARYRGSRGGVRRGPTRCRWALLWVAVLDSRGGRGCRGQEKAVVLLGALGGVGSSCIAGAVRRHLEVEFTHNIARMGPCLEMWHSGLPPTPLCQLAVRAVTCRADGWGVCPALPLLPSESATWRRELASCDRRPELFRVVKQRPDQHHHVCQQRAILHPLLVRAPSP